jgi:hypothetical protein
MEDNVIETSIDKLIEFLREKEKINISEAADFLGVTHKQLEPWLNILEENGIIEIKYPVIGEPKIILKPTAPEKIEFKKLKTKEKAEEAKTKEEFEVRKEKKSEEEITIETPKLREKVEMKPEIRESEPKPITEKIEGLENKITELSREVDVSMLKEELSEILLIVAGLKDIEKISFYLREVLSLIHKMKEKNIWAKEDKELVITMLKTIADNWKEYGEIEIAKVFEDVSKKVEVA